MPDFDDEYSPSSKSDSSDGEDAPKANSKTLSLDIKSILTTKSSDEDDEGDGLRTTATTAQNSSSYASKIQLDSSESPPQSCGGQTQTERRRRKLPEIPKNRCEYMV